MKSFYTLKNFAVLFMMLLSVHGTVQAAVGITKANNGTCVAITPGPYSTLTNIIISETATGDFASQAGATLILTAPTGLEFKAGAGSVTYLGGMDITSASVVVTTTTITVTLNIGGTAGLDVLRIRNIEVVGTTANASGDILRTATGGTATIAGDAPGAGVSHGYLSVTGTGAAITSVSPGNWSSSSTWSGGVVPSCTDNVVIAHQVTVDNSVNVNDITINSNGNLIADQSVTVQNNFTMNGTAIYTHNNLVNASSTIFNGAETFSSTSKIVLLQWYNRNIPFPTNVSGDFGSVDFNYSGSWNQGGLFAPARLKGTLSVLSGTVILDNGSGMTTALTLQDVNVTGTGNLMVQSGTARDLTLVTGNFNDNSIATGKSSIAFRSVGNLNWTVNGNLSLSHRFSLLEGTSPADIGTAIVTVNGNFDITGGSFEGVRLAAAPLTMNVTGNTTISGAPTSVYFKDSYSGDLIFTTTNMNVTGGAGNYFMGRSNPMGSATINILNNFTLTGAATRFYVNSSTSSSAVIQMTVGNDLILTDGQLTIGNHLGDVNLNVSRNLTVSGITSQFFGQRYVYATGNNSLTVNGTFSLTGGVFYHSRGLGNTTLAITETCNIQNATFNGMNNSAAGNNGSASLSCTDFVVSGSRFYLHRGEITDGRQIDVNVTNDVNINFVNSSDAVIFINRSSSNNATLSLNVGNNFIVSGVLGGLFTSSCSSGDETVSIGADMMISGGRVRFNGNENTSGAGHDVIATITGSLMVSGGSLGLSTLRGMSTWNINNDYNQTGGFVFHKYNTGGSSVTVAGDYNQSSGDVSIYNRSTVATTDNQTLTINGAASFDNTTLLFDSCATSTATHTVYFKGPSVTIGNTVTFSHINHLSTRTIFGSIMYDRVGTIAYLRNSDNFDIRQVKQTITPGTTLDASGSTYDLLVSSHSSAVAAVHTTLTVNGTLDMGVKMIKARDQASYYSSVTVNDGARLITGHTNGLYSGTSSNSCVFPEIASSLRMNYYLGANSVVEYNGLDTQIITGVGLGLATTSNHQYGNLEINFQGTPDVEYAYPFDDNVFVRTGLVLTAGELNLDDDHVTASGGRVLNLLNGATISRTTGYIRSETEDGSGTLAWDITTTGNFIIPFGYNSTSYIPFTYQPTSGSSGTVMLATYRSLADNSPYPPTVTHVRDLMGADNSGFTVDRFWRIVVPGSASSNLIFSFTPSEGSGIANPRAQLWEPVTQGWYPASGVQSNPTATTTQANGQTAFNNWWTLSAQNNPLPIQLLSFDAFEHRGDVKLNWATATEINNDYFTIQRSRSGDNFTDLFTVDGAGNSSTTLNYSAFDYNPGFGINYYRLKQTDYDGRVSFSHVRQVTINRTAPVSVFPNPLRGTTISISTGDNADEVTGIKIMDFSGKIVLEKVAMATSQRGGNISEFEIGNDLPTGIYMLEIKTNSGVHHEKLIKQ